MSYASTMQFLNTGMASGGGTEDPRYAGFSGGCGSTARPCGAPIAGQTTRFGYEPAWRLTPGAYHDYSSTFRVPGAPPSPGESQVAHTAAIAGAHDDCVSTCAALCEAMHEHPAPLVPPAPQTKPAVVRPMWERGHMAHFSSIAGKSRADAIRLTAKRARGRAARPKVARKKCPEGYLQPYCKKWDYSNTICLESGSRCVAPYMGATARVAKVAASKKKAARAKVARIKAGRAVARPPARAMSVKQKVHHAMQTGQNFIVHNGQQIPVGCGFVEWDEGVVAKCCTPGTGDYDFDKGNEVCVMFPL